ncbi:MAG: amylo-alpha-1,6-glucosidase [Gemmatimonadota bacterium]|nr:amylo-alpha-1,6-glucosidase [Gemmatimonadota bacterium]
MPETKAAPGDPGPGGRAPGVSGPDPVPPIRFTAADLQDFAVSSRLEWLETNGLGGWASSTVSGAHTRRYHGLLVAALRPPLGRFVLLSRLEETLATGGVEYDLASNRFPGVLHPSGHRHLASFELGLFPTFGYRAGEVVLRKTIAAVHGENTTLVRYELTEADRPAGLTLRPFLAARDYHSLARANDAIGTETGFADDTLRVRPYEGTPALFLHLPGARYRTAPPQWYYQYEYDAERERGLDFREDLWMPGALEVRLAPGEVAWVVASTENPAGRDPAALFEAERGRRLALLARAGLPGRDGSPEPAGLPGEPADPRLRRLVLAADQFIVRRGEKDRTVIAGYPWFGDWGRDTMIALPGLALCTGRPEDAAGILRAFAETVDGGMLPNRFPDGGEEPEYNSVDAALWFFVAVRAYLERTGDEDLARGTLLPALREIRDAFTRGTRHGIRVAADGLLEAGEPGVQLTWMDAKVGEWVVTPRHGKPVEVNALWYNALRILADLERRLGDPAAAGPLEEEARRCLARFREAFWNEAGGCLFDVVTDEGADPAIRPNQVFAIGLPFPLLDGERARRVLAVVQRDLLTPLGLRSLAPGDPAYRPRYEGGVLERDGAYHQGTVWSWLLGPYVTALARVRAAEGRAAEAREEARALLAPLLDHLSDAGLGSVSEIFDAEPPHRPRGAPAQAWSVAELLRAWREHVLDEPADDDMEHDA